MKYGKSIREQRMLNGYTQDEVAKKLHTSRSSVTNWELDRALPDIVSIIHMADIFGTTIDELVGRTEKQKNKPADIADLLKRADAQYRGVQIPDDCRENVLALLEIMYAKTISKEAVA